MQVQSAAIKLHRQSIKVGCEDKEDQVKKSQAFIDINIEMTEFISTWHQQH